MRSPFVSSQIFFFLSGLTLFINLGPFVASAVGDIQISGLSDLIPEPWSGFGEIRVTEDFCIAGSDPKVEPTPEALPARNQEPLSRALAATDALQSNSFRLEVHPQGASSQFFLQNGQFQLPFRMWFRQGGGSPVELSPNVAQSFPLFLSSVGCAGGSNSTLEVTISDSELRKAREGSYSGNISLTVTAE